MIEQFYRAGLEKGFMSEDGEVLDEVAYDWYFATIFEKMLKSSDPFDFRNYVENCLEKCISYLKDEHL